jgi:hypothetical protein
MTYDELTGVRHDPSERCAREAGRRPSSAKLARRHAGARAIEIDGPAERLRELAAALGRRIRRRPIASLLAAIGIGFVVGGALSFRAGRIALAAAGRHVGRELLKQVL